MGHLAYLYDLIYDPTDANNPRGTYSPYDFTSVGRSGIAKGSMTRDWGRRESIAVIPGMDSVLDGNGRLAAPMERRDVTFAFTVWTNGNNDAAESLLRAQVAPGYPQRLVYRTDSGTLWYTVGYNPSIKQTSASEDNWGGGGECNFAVTWRIRPWWTLRFSQASDIWGFQDGVWGTSDGTWGGSFTTTLSLATTNFFPDATGTAGADLPTLPDTGPVVTINGPFGGDGGILVVNGSDTTTAADGGAQNVQIVLPRKIAAGEYYYLDCGAQRFLLNGLPFRPIRPVQQRYWFAILPGIVNNCAIYAVGANVLTGGTVSLDWWKRIA